MGDVWSMAMSEITASGGVQIGGDTGKAVVRLGGYVGL